MGKKKSKSAKKARAGQIGGSEEVYKKAPHTFVIPRGHVGKNINLLIQDVRRVMEPFTASSLKVKKKNVLQDFVGIAGTLNVSHIIMFTKTDSAMYMRLIRQPRGPTLTFRLLNYTLSADVISSLRKHNMEAKQFQHHPLLVMNNFSGEGMQLKLMASMFQNMFPSINVNKVKLNSIRRCVLMNYNTEMDEIEFRHYNIRAVPVGMSRGVKKLIQARVPNMARYTDVSELLIRGDQSESEAELDGPHNEIVLPQEMSSRGNIKSAKSAIRLTEIGPRMTLELIKIQEGVCTGEVLFHRFIEKTEEEKQMLKEKLHKKKNLKEQRKKQQAENVKKKEELKAQHKKKSLAGMKGKDTQGEDEKESSEDEVTADMEYFKREVGHNPDPELFPKTSSRKRKSSGGGPSHHNLKKKRKAPVEKDGGKFQKGNPEKKNKKELTPMQKILEKKKKKMKAQLKGKPGAKKKRVELKKQTASDAKRLKKDFKMSDPKRQKKSGKTGHQKPGKSGQQKPGKTSQQKPGKNFKNKSR